MSLSTPDTIIIGIIVLSVLIGIVRGFVKELISLVTWIVAIFLAVRYSNHIAAFMTFTDHKTVRNIVAFIIIFVGTIFVGALINYGIGSLVRKTPFSIADKILGGGFGIPRGGALVTLLILLGGLTSFPEEPWWKKSPMIAYFQGLALWVKEQLPDENAKVFHLSSEKQIEGED